ncbi:AMP-dependent synthetase [Actinomadura sp. KC345]|uniref:class I adenylate-forming enzyme family protein n=1 Tax=Actinomadura sp. KC345 TaxID=2530371 RepID=UPI001045E7BC|nr:AMP-binding protein [Actinomadura sp. KC345]TDC56377.1 AMP-dependent synthetase [Actinomadura sp. KC345]
MTEPVEDPLTTQAAANPAKTALIEDERHLTYAEFNALVNRYANVLVDHGVTAGTKVVWCGRNSTEVVALISALRKCGAVGVPLNYRLSPEEASYVVENADAAVVVFDVEQAPQLEEASRRAGTVRAWLVWGAAQGAPDWASSLDALAAASPESEPAAQGTDPAAGTSMFYTSGTTGKPKGVVRGPTDLELVLGLVGEIGYAPDDVYLTTGPLYHSGPQAFMMIVQLLGGTVVVMRDFDPERWLDLVERHRVTTTFSAPTPIRRVVDLPDETIRARDLSSMKRLIANAAPWPFELKRRYIEKIGEGSLFEVYGSTELGVDTILRPEDQLRKPGSCGRAAPGVEIALFDEDGRPVEQPHVPGDLYVRGSATFSDYYKDEGKYRDASHGEWLTVGDIAYRDEEGFYYICDRRSDMIISGGMNIYPAEIEAVLTAHPSVADAAVFGIPSDEWGESVHAAIVASDDVTDQQLRDFCREHLASYKTPRGFDRIKEIPRNPSGKTLKRQLRDPYWESRDSKIG